MKNKEKMNRISNCLAKTLLFVSLILPLSAIAQTKIIGGTQIDIKDAPYQVSMDDKKGAHLCGGTILSDRWILTAAHCVDGRTPSNITVHAGSSDQTNNALGQRILAQSIYTHPLYDPGVDTNDIALIYLSQSLEFNHSVVPIEYATTCNTSIADYTIGNSAYLTGWGVTCSSCPFATYLQGVTMPLISRSNAMAINLAYNALFIRNINDNMIPFYDFGSGVGPGDSGGPAIINKNGYKIVIGASSWGYSPKDQLPTVYTHVRNYASWIDSISGFTINSTGIDLYTKDKPWDMGFEPFSYQYPWTSEDIWVRNQIDTIEEHQNPEYSMGSNPVYVKVRVRNKGCNPSVGNEVLKVYWAKASTSLSWPNNWNGNISINNIPLGGVIDSVTLPVIQPGDAYIASIPWLPPHPSTYAAISSNPIFFANEPHHFCLLSRIESSLDGMATLETTNVGSNVLNNNNIAWKNISVVDSITTNLTDPQGNDIPVGASVLVGNPNGVGGIFNIKFCDFLETGLINVSEYAEIKVTLDEPLWELWEDANFDAENVEIVNIAERKIMIGNGCGILKGITFQPEEFSLLHVSFNFLVDDYTLLDPVYKYNVILTNNEGQIFGGETYVINTVPRDGFDADAGQNQQIIAGDSAQLSALQINENAIYNWYDESGELIYTGTNFTVSPEVSQTYKLEVIAALDGYKDYDELNVKVKNNYISNISPNPATNNVNITYKLNDVQSAYLVLVQNQSNTSSQYVLNVIQQNININTYSLNNGTYSVILVVNGETADYQNLLIQH